MKYQCSDKLCGYTTTLSNFKKVETPICPKCKKQTIRLKDSWKFDKDSGKAFVMKRSNIMREAATYSSVPIIHDENGSRLDEKKYSPYLTSIYNNKQTAWCHPISKIKIITSELNWVAQLNKPSVLLCMGVSSYDGGSSSREIIRLDTSSTELNSIYQVFKEQLYKQVKGTYSLSGLVRYIFEAALSLSKHLLSKKDEVATNQLKQIYYNKRRDLNSDRLPCCDNYHVTGFVMDIEVFINNGTGVCRHRNLLVSYLLGRLAAESSKDYQTKFQVPCSSNYLNFVATLKKIFNLKTAVCQVRGNLLSRPSEQKLEDKGAHTWCVVYLYSTNRKISGPWIVDAMWGTVLNLGSGPEYHAAYYPKIGHGCTYGFNNVIPIMQYYNERKIQSLPLKKTTNSQLPSIPEIPMMERRANHREKAEDYLNTCAWATELKAQFNSISQYINLTGHVDKKSMKTITDIFGKLDLQDINNSYVYLITTRPNYQDRKEEIFSLDIVNRFINQCITIIEYHMTLGESLKLN